MTLMETLMLVAISSASALMTFTVISIAKPSSRKEMGVRLPEDEDLETEMRKALSLISNEDIYLCYLDSDLGKDEDNGYTKPDLDADTF
jgi:hypothetical protein